MQYFLDTVETIPEGLGWSLFSGYHFLWLGILVAFAAFMSIHYKKKDYASRAKWRKAMAVAILLDEVWKMFWLTVGGRYLPDYLPLHLCSINIILIAIHAWKPSKTLDNFLYAICIPGAVAAMLFSTWTPLPTLNFMHLHSFTVHILLITYPVMLTVGGDIKPDWRQLPKSLLFTLCLAIPVYFINLALDTNFMFLMYAEDGNPLLLFEQLLGNHLWGIPVLGAVFIGLMYGVLYVCRKAAAKKTKV